MAAELTQAGCRVWEALSISEVLYLLETEKIDVVVIDCGVDRDLNAFQGRQITIRLQPGSTLSDLIWELSLLFGGDDAVVH